ncbi:unnamed protein product [Protopolystoma xenopodis]|uniref:Uncharacterized protein n=1 Tax=Protopolystoma xenopodis TaxID=117903 RepID=A0A3S5A027_9PLAT|nr:unnamed protein product [Protopolystoma xenopodis]
MMRMLLSSNPSHSPLDVASSCCSTGFGSTGASATSAASDTGLTGPTCTPPCSSVANSSTTTTAVSTMSGVLPGTTVESSGANGYGLGPTGQTSHDFGLASNTNLTALISEAPSGVTGFAAAAAAAAVAAAVATSGNVDTRTSSNGVSRSRSSGTASSTANTGQQGPTISRSVQQGPPKHSFHDLGQPNGYQLASGQQQQQQQQQQASHQSHHLLSHHGHHQQSQNYNQNHSHRHSHGHNHAYHRLTSPAASLLASMRVKEESFTNAKQRSKKESHNRSESPNLIHFRNFNMRCIHPISFKVMKDWWKKFPTMI